VLSQPAEVSGSRGRARLHWAAPAEPCFAGNKQTEHAALRFQLFLGMSVLPAGKKSSFKEGFSEKKVIWDVSKLENYSKDIS